MRMNVWLQDESNAMKQQLVKVMRENTRKLNDLHQLTNQGRELEDKLNNRQKSMVKQNNQTILVSL